MSRSDLVYVIMEFKQDDCDQNQACASVRHRGHQSLPSTPEEVENLEFEQQLSAKLDTLSISPARQSRRNSQILNPYHCRRQERDDFRPRACSMPSQFKQYKKIKHNEEFSPEFQRVRSFSISGKGILNRGDSFKRVNRCASGDMHSSVISEGSSVDSTQTNCTVLVMGPTGVGKSSLIQQFTTSEYTGGEDISLAGKPASTPYIIMVATFTIYI